MDDADDTLMRRAGRGDRAACEALVVRHLGRMIALAQRMLGNRNDAEDASQEIFLKVWAAAPRWRAGEARFTTWLHRIAVNCCLDRLAARRPTSSVVPDLVDDRADPSLLVAASDVGRHVNDALAELPESQRLAVTLCHYQGLRNRDAAEIMGVTVEALESLLVRGRRTLRDRLQDVAPALLERG